MPQGISIDLIQAVPELQMREGLRTETVEEYRGLFNGKGWPFKEPLKVFQDVDKYWLADGFHRFEAAKQAGRSSVSCEVTEGTLDDAQDFAFSANNENGLRRTNADKRRAVTRALGAERHSEKSNREIARLCAVSEAMVRNMIAELSPKPYAEVRTVRTQNTFDTANSVSVEKENSFSPDPDGQKSTPEEVEYEYVEKDESEPLEPGEIDCGPVEPEKPWTFYRNKAVNTCEALMRAIGDLKAVKPGKQQDRLTKGCDFIWKELKKW